MLKKWFNSHMVWGKYLYSRKYMQHRRQQVDAVDGRNGSRPHETTSEKPPCLLAAQLLGVALIHVRI
jgi:hypothetical protein